MLLILKGQSVLGLCYGCTNRAWKESVPREDPLEGTFWKGPYQPPPMSETETLPALDFHPLNDTFDLITGTSSGQD